MSTEKNQVRINGKKVEAFLRSLTRAEFSYVDHCMEMSKSLKKLIAKHGISRDDFCERFDIKDSQYDDFVSGAFNYKLSDMSNLNAEWIGYEMEELKEKAPFQICKDPITTTPTHSKAD